MAITLLPGSTARIDYGDVAAFAGIAALSCAVTLKVGAAPATGAILCSKFGLTDPTAAFLLDVVDTDELRFLCHTGAGSTTYMGRKTTTLNLANGSTYRIVCTWDGTSAGIHIWVNGVDQTTANSNNVGISGALTTTATPLQVGYNSTRSAVNLSGVYSEFACWSEVIPSWVSTSYGLGMSPRFYRRSTSLLYTPLANTTALTDQWFGRTGTNSSGTNAVHPLMYYPTGPVPSTTTGSGSRVFVLVKN